MVTTITANRDRWVDTILQEERHLQPVGNDDTLRRSAVITIATLVGHLVALLPFLVMSRHAAIVLDVAFSALVLFGVGVYSALTRVGVWWKSGLKMVIIGLGAAAIGFGIGRLFNASGGSASPR